MERRILVLEDEAESKPSPLASLALDAGTTLQRLRWADFLDPTAEKDAELGHPDLTVAVDLGQPPALEAHLGRIRALALGRPVLAVLGAAVSIDALDAIARAVDDFLLWPASASELDCRVRRLLGGATDGRCPGLDAAVRSTERDSRLRELVGESPAFHDVIARIPRVAATEAPVLITGETGTGKELVARAIHRLSRRVAGPFVPVDCSAVPENLFENEMFGHERGAFTDAHRTREGLVAMARGGTLFLDEVDSLGPSVQAKLLRLLQEKTYRPLGSETFRTADVRVLAASNRDLTESVRRQQLRSDLFFRLDVLRLHLPPLRERTGDVGLLARELLRGLAVPGGPSTLSSGALRKLALYDWPGNVRELSTVLQRAAVFAAGHEIATGDVELPGTAPAISDFDRPFRAVRAEALAAFEKGYVDDLLRRHAGNVTRAARAAKAERRSFGRLVKKYGLRVPAAV